MLPHAYWMRPDPDGELRRANEARAAVLYQGFRQIGRLTRTVLGLLWRLGEAPLKLVRRWRLKKRTVHDLNRIDHRARNDIGLPDGALDDLAQRMEAQGVPSVSPPPARISGAVHRIAWRIAARLNPSPAPTRQAAHACCSG